MKLLINTVCAAVILVPMVSHAAAAVSHAQVIKELDRKSTV